MSEEVLFFPIIYEPDQLTAKRLQYIQNQMEMYHAELAFLTRDYSRIDASLFKENNRAKIRSSWELIKGEKA